MQFVMNIVSATIEKNHPWSIWLKTSIPAYDVNGYFEFRFTGTDIEEYTFGLTDEIKENLIHALQDKLGYGGYSQVNRTGCYCSHWSRGALLRTCQS